MKKANDDIDRLAKDLISKGLLKPESFDFDDRLMAKITLAPSPERLKSNGNHTKKAWFLLTIAVVFLLISVLIIATFSKGYFSEVSNVFQLIFSYVLYSGMALFVPLVLYHLDALIQLMYWKKSNKMSTI